MLVEHYNVPLSYNTWIRRRHGHRRLKC